MMKPYILRTGGEVTDLKVVPVMSAVLPPAYSPENDGLIGCDAKFSGGRLQNSAILSDLDTYLSYLPVQQCGEVGKLIRGYPTLFSDAPSQMNVLVHDTDAGQNLPIKQFPYRVNPAKREIMRAEVKYLLQNGLAKPSESPWSSPCLLVPKPDSTCRFCMDYRKVNSSTKKDSFPLPRLEDCVDRVGSAKYVTKLDLLKGYWQVLLTPRASEISAFVTPDNFLQYSVLAFGMQNAPATFQRLMHKVLANIPNCAAYLDDIVIYSDGWQEHLQSLEHVFQHLEEALLTLNLAKCEFAKAVVTYLGKQVGQGQVRPIEAKVTAMLKFPTSTNKRQLRRFLGMTGYYRGFCRNFACIVSPLTDLLSTSRSFVWTPECECAFLAAKDILCNAPVLSAPNFDLPFKLQVDASAMGAGAVLMQEDSGGVDHPVSYYSKNFSKCQLHYSTIEKEAVALMLALQHFEVYVGGSSTPVVVYTDHNPLYFCPECIIPTNV